MLLCFTNISLTYLPHPHYRHYHQQHHHRFHIITSTINTRINSTVTSVPLNNTILSITTTTTKLTTDTEHTASPSPLSPLPNLLFHHHHHCTTTTFLSSPQTRHLLPPSLLRSLPACLPTCHNASLSLSQPAPLPATTRRPAG